MKILIVPMAAMAETHGPSSRCRSLALGFRSAGFEVATCMAEDVNYRKIDGVPNYFLDVPMPLGLPEAIAARAFPIAQKLGITSRKAVDSFDQVLWFTGNLDYRYLAKSVSDIRKAIRDYRPDILYSEFNLSAVIAAKKEGIPLYSTVSFPTQYEYAHRTDLAKGLNRLLGELQLPQVDSALRLFDWADKAFCLSIRELEPIDKPNVVFCGTLKTVKPDHSRADKRNSILIYMGNGSVSAQEIRNVAVNAFQDGIYDVYIASASLREGTWGRIHVAPRWDFDALLKEAVLFINHGGQNSMVDGLLYGVPQLVVPGKVFERKFNAACLAGKKAGVVVEQREFSPDHIRSLAEKTAGDREMSDNAAALGRKLLTAGGMETIIKELLPKR